MEARLLLATIVVTGTGDTIAADGVVTFREAITAANTNAASGDAPAGDSGLDTIAFNLPGSGIQTITPTSELPMIFEAVTIDGYTQPGARPNTLAIGDDAVLLIEVNGASTVGQPGLDLGGGGGSTVRGLAINRFGEAGVRLQSSGNRIEGNFLGTDPTGTIARGNFDGIRFSPNNSANTIGGTTPAARNLISGNHSSGITALASDFTTSDLNVIQGNYIGTNAAGTAALGNQANGISIGGGTGDTIGGTIPGAGNLISGNGMEGIGIGSVTRLATNSHVIQGNFIGTDATGTAPLGNGEDGILFRGLNPPTFGNTIGGLAAGAGNLIAFNGRSGIGVADGNGHAILRNSIHSNSGLGISLGGGRTPTPNDPGDGDVGYNNLQNFPVLTAITSAGGSTAIAGTLDSTPSTTVRIEFFANAAPDPSSFGEGQTFIGFADVTTDAGGIATFTTTLSATTVGPTQFVTSTATDLNGNTSEFSQLVADLGVAITGAPANAAVGQDLTYQITVTNSGPFPAAGATLTDTIPANATFISATGGVTPTAGVLTFPLGTLPVGGTASFTVVLRAAALGRIDHTIATTSTVSDPSTTNNTATASTNIDAAASADLTITLSDRPDPVTAGGDLTYTFSVANAGPSAATGVTLTDTLPSGVTFVSATGGVTPVGNTLTFDLGTLANTAGATVTVVVRPTRAGTLTNSAGVTSAVGDPVPANNADTLTTTVNAAPAASADLVVTLAGTPGRVTVGANLVYTIVVTNNGPGAAQGLTLTTAVPAGATFVSLTAPVGWTATTPAAGGTGTISATAAGLGTGDAGLAAFRLVVRVRPGAAGGTPIHLTAGVAAATGDPTPVSNSAAASTTVVAAPPTNTAPTASADTYAATAGVALRVPARGVLGNDTDPENDVLSAVLKARPAHGALTLNADGSFTYTPAAGFSGTDTFTYRASDGLLTSAPATVALNVAAAPPSRDTTGPRVTGLRRFGFHAQPTRLVLAFDERLAAAGASNPMNYRLVDAGRDGRFGTRDDAVIALRSATYDPTSRTVSLVTRRPLPLRRPYQLTVHGGPGGPRDLTGNFLNRIGNGTNGSVAVVSFDRAALAGPSIVGATPRKPGRFALAGEKVREGGHPTRNPRRFPR